MRIINYVRRWNACVEKRLWLKKKKKKWTRNNKSVTLECTSIISVSITKSRSIMKMLYNWVYLCFRLASRGHMRSPVLTSFQINEWKSRWKLQNVAFWNWRKSSKYCCHIFSWSWFVQIQLIFMFFFCFAFPLHSISYVVERPELPWASCVIIKIFFDLVLIKWGWEGFHVLHRPYFGD